MANCKICGTETRAFGSAHVLHKYDVGYYQCPVCRFVQTEPPYWLEEAYVRAIAAADVGIAYRNLLLSNITEAVIRRLFNPDARFLDHGGGHGLFVRLMRDRGFDFRWADAYADNIFSRGFEGGDGEQYDLITAFEVFEHLQDPLAEIGRMVGMARALLFSTVLLPPSNPHPGDWWYYLPSTGQHVAVYAPETLQVLAQRFGRHLVSNGSTLHLLSDRPVSRMGFRLLTRPTVARLINAVSPRRTPLIEADFRAVTGEDVNGAAWP